MGAPKLGDALDVVMYVLEHAQQRTMGGAQQMQFVAVPAAKGVHLRGLVQGVMIADQVVDRDSLEVALDYFRSECRRLGVEASIVGEVD